MKETNDHGEGAGIYTQVMRRIQKCKSWRDRHERASAMRDRHEEERDFTWLRGLSAWLSLVRRLNCVDSTIVLT